MKYKLKSGVIAIILLVNAFGCQNEKRLNNYNHAAETALINYLHHRNIKTLDTCHVVMFPSMVCKGCFNAFLQKLEYNKKTPFVNNATLISHKNHQRQLTPLNPFYTVIYEESMRIDRLAIVAPNPTLITISNDKIINRIVYESTNVKDTPLPRH